MSGPVLRSGLGRVLVWGGGGVGGTFAARWARTGLDVLPVDVVAEHVEACRTDGLAIEGPVESLRQRVPATVPDEVEGVFERVVLAVKAPATKDATARLAAHLAPDGYVLSAQNGLNELALAERLGADQVMGAFVNFGADWLGPGRVLLGNRGAVVVGEIDGTVRERTREMHATLRLFEPEAVLAQNVWGYLRGKLGYGAMLFATALAPDAMADDFADPERAPVLAGLAREVMAVAVASATLFLASDEADWITG